MGATGLLMVIAMHAHHCAFERPDNRLAGDRGLIVFFERSLS